jgi:hypothetical protein
VLRLNRRLQREGLDEEAAAAVCLDFDLAVAGFGAWVERRLKETREVPLPRNQKPKPVKHVPKYPQLRAALGLHDDPAPATAKPSRKRAVPPGGRTKTTKAIDQKVDQLRRDPAALADFLRLDGDP